MANISGTFAANGTSAALTIGDGKTVAYFSISGDFKAHITREFSNDSGVTWSDIDSIGVAHDGNDPTEAGQCYRFTCSNYVSGTVTYSASDDSGVLKTFFNSSGAKVLEIHEDGINVIGTIKHNGVAVHE